MVIAVVTTVTLVLTVSPSEPAGFLQTLVALVNEEVRRVQSVTAEDDDSVAPVRRYADYVLGHGETVAEELENAEFGSFEVLPPVLDYNHSWKIYTARTLRTEYKDDPPLESRDALDDVVERLRFFGPAREYFKSQYFQWEVINASRVMLYTAMPALALAAYMILAFDPSGVTGETLGIADVVWVVSATFVVTLLPFGALLAFLLRMLTVVKRTLASGPFILRSTHEQR